MPMKKLKYSIAPILFSLIIVACGGGGSSSSVSSNVTSILAVGDSIGAGFGGTTPWPSLVGSQSGVPVTNNSVNGREVAGSVGLVSSLVSSVNPSHLIIMLGTNDATSFNSGGAINAMSQIIQNAEAAGVVIIVGTIPPILSNSSFNAEAAQISAGYRTLGAPIAEVEGAFGGGTPDLFISDLFHPNNTGQQLIADAFLSNL